jgi:hypothetical protein
MARRIREPAWTLRELRWPSEPLWTAPLPPALFSGDTVHLLAGFRRPPTGEVQLAIAGAEGRQVPGRASLAAAVSEAGVLARVAAARRLAVLDDEQAAALAERYQLASRFTAFVVTVTRARGEQALQLPELRAVPQMLAAGWAGAGRVRSELAGASPRSRGVASMVESSAPPRSRTRSRGVASETPTYVTRRKAAATLDAAAIARLLEAVGRGWVPANLEDLEQAGCPIEVIREIVLADRDGLGWEDLALLWLAVLVQTVDAQRLDPPASPRLAAALGDRRWRVARRACKEQVKRLVGA